MIPIAKPLLGEEEKRAVLEVLESGMLAQGKKVAEFEQEFAKFIGVRQAIATSNGTTALHAALLAHGITTGDEVITTPFSFIATANTIRMVGATAVFVDIDEKTFNIDAQLIEAAITPKTKAILPVHLFGLPAPLDTIQALAHKYGLVIIEDACQAHGAEFQGRKVGSFGTGCFSFYPTKNMTTGEGGMITTNDHKIAKKIRKIINHGSEQKYIHSGLGYNYRMTDLAAAIGIEQLKKLPAFNQKRREHAAILTKQLASLPGLVVPELVTGHVFHQYTIRVTEEGVGKEGIRKMRKRDELAAQLHQHGIATNVYYPLAIHQQQAYAHYPQRSFPVTEKVSREVLSLPIHPALTEDELFTIINLIKEVAGRNET
ncbi:MAG: DegT/DnrJ/EryC1/StrS family aminotransferase [Nanoarchaeota archaeon]